MYVQIHIINENNLKCGTITNSVKETKQSSGYGSRRQVRGSKGVWEASKGVWKNLKQAGLGNIYGVFIKYEPSVNYEGCEGWGIAF